MRSRWLAAVVVLLAGCTTSRQFAPREHLGGYGPGGEPAATYAVQDGAARGELRVWSRGSRTVAGDGDGAAEVAEVHVGFELENDGEVPLALDAAAIRAEELTADGRQVTDLRPVRSQGGPAAAPHRTARYDVWFRPGEGIRAAAIDGFTVRFAVRVGEQGVLEQATPFQPWSRATLHPGYDPWWGPGPWHPWFGSFGPYPWYGPPGWYTRRWPR